MVRSDFIMEIRGYLVSPAERRLRAPWRLLVWLFAAAFGAIVVAAAGTAIPLPGGGGPAAALYAMGRQVGIIVAALVVAMGIGYLLDRRTLADYGLGLDTQWWRDAAFGLCLGVALPTLAFAVQLAAGFTTVTGTFPTGPSDTFQFGSTGAPFRLALLAAFFLVQASAEEILVRGYLLTNLAEGLAGTLGRVRAIVAATVATGALFGVLHGANPGTTVLSTANITLYGVFFGLCYVVTGRLAIPCGFHIAWNYTLVVWDFPVSGLQSGAALVDTTTSGPVLVTGGGFGPEGGLIALPLLAVAAGLLYWWTHREYGDLEILDAIAVPDLRIPTRGGQQ